MPVFDLREIFLIALFVNCKLQLPKNKLKKKADSKISITLTQHYLKDSSAIYKPSSWTGHEEQQKLAILHTIHLFVLDNLDPTCHPTAQIKENPQQNKSSTQGRKSERTD